MAKQHFYSRVPARIAMFYKSNGFDTFAKSDGITQQFIEKDLQGLLEQKPTQEELTLIRKNELKPIYFHFSTKEGTFVESCVSFLASDYTNERSAYLVHSLIFNEDEEKEVHYHNHSSAINENLFIHDLSSFDITSSQAKPIKDYKELNYSRDLLPEPIDWLTKEYNSNTLKVFIFSLFGIIYGKYKCVHVILPNNKNSENSLRFFNNVIQIIPFHLRKYISFVSKCLDFNKYPGFNLKIIDESMGVAPISKGITINFKTQDIFGIKEKELSTFSNIPEFLYRLISKKEERYELFKFIDYAISKDSSKANLDIKQIIELVYLFKASSGFYDENHVLPDDDSVYELFVSYENNRECLKDENRINALKCLQRYPDTYNIVPKQVFAKIVKLYPTEIDGTKHVIMQVLLELIHTDLMRPSIFSFIKSNYDKENEESKTNIIRHLASVFNGEFLQDSILEFFKKYFDYVNLEARQIIIENLYLAIRTVAIQDGLFNFFNEKYSLFDESEKIKFYDVCAEHLPEGDELARKLLALCDKHIEHESENLQESYSNSLCKMLLDEQKNKVELLLPLVCESNGFTFDIVTREVFTNWQRKKISNDFITLCCKGKLTDRIDKIIKIFNLVNKDLDTELNKKFTDAIVLGFKNNECITNVSEIFTCQLTLEKGLPKLDKTMVEQFLKKMKITVFDKLLYENFATVFECKNKNIVEKVAEYAKDCQTLKLAKNFKIINDYLALKNAICEGNVINMINSIKDILNYWELSTKVSSYLIVDIYHDYMENNDDNYTSRIGTLALISSFFLKTSHLKLNNVYEKLVERVTNNYLDEEYNQPIIQEDICKIFKNILEVAYIIENEFSKYPSLENDMQSYEAGIQVAAGDLVSRYGRKQLEYLLDSIKFKNKKLNKFIEKETRSIKAEKAKVIKV